MDLGFGKENITTLSCSYGIATRCASSASLRFTLLYFEQQQMLPCRGLQTFLPTGPLALDLLPQSRASALPGFRVQAAHLLGVLWRSRVLRVFSTHASWACRATASATALTSCACFCLRRPARLTARRATLGASPVSFLLSWKSCRQPVAKHDATHRMGLCIQISTWLAPHPPFLLLLSLAANNGVLPGRFEVRVVS